jgi:hypothetical protein
MRVPLRRKPIEIELPEFGISAFTSQHASTFVMPFCVHDYHKVCYVRAGCGQLQWSRGEAQLRGASLIRVPARLRQRFIDDPDTPMTLNMLCCFGNYGGQSIQKGHWGKLLTLMNRLHCDHVVLEFAFGGYDELEYFRDGLDERIGLGVGVVDVKMNTVESPQLVAERIEAAARMVGPERIRWVHPDCGFWMNRRSVADRKIANLVRGRDLFLGTTPEA